MAVDNGHGFQLGLLAPVWPYSRLGQHSDYPFRCNSTLARSTLRAIYASPNLFPFYIILSDAVSNHMSSLHFITSRRGGGVLAPDPSSAFQASNFFLRVSSPPRSTIVRRF